MARSAQAQDEAEKEGGHQGKQRTQDTVCRAYRIRVCVLGTNCKHLAAPYRYTVMAELVNFMFPVEKGTSDDATRTELCRSLFSSV
mgnify:CR=1 FL=1